MLTENDLPHELLLTARQKTKLRNAFNNNMSTDLRLSKAQIIKIIQSRDFFSIIILAPLGIAAATSAIDAGIQKKIHGSGIITLIISNKEMNDIMKIVQALEDSNILLKGVTKTIKNEKEKKNMGIVKHVVGCFNPIQDGLFWGCSQMAGVQKGIPSVKSVTHILQQ